MNKKLLVAAMIAISLLCACSSDTKEPAKPASVSTSVETVAMNGKEYKLKTFKLGANDFKDKYNQEASRLGKGEFSIKDFKTTKSDGSTVYEYSFTKNCGLLLKESGSGNISEIMLMDNSKSGEDTAQTMAVFGIIIGVLTPEIKIEDRLAFIRKLVLDEKIKTDANEITQNNVTYGAMLMGPVLSLFASPK